MSLPSNIREQEFSRIVDAGHIYVDYTGGGQCPASVLNRYHELALSTTFGNPHSFDPTASHTTELIEEVRDLVLSFFQAGDEYELIFTQNASGACQIIGENYPWSEEHVLLLARDNHNSVLGIREYAKSGGAQVEYWELDDELRLLDTLEELINKYKGKQVVVAYPAQSNFSGVMHPLEFVKQAKELGAEVFLDIAAFVPTHEINLQEVNADAYCLSFYKILGFPTGIGALIIKKEFLRTLKKAWFAGGTVRGVSLEDHVLESGHERFENGTVDYALIPALKYVLEFVESVGGISAIEQHVSELTERALNGIKEIENVVVYGPITMQSRGGTIAFNIMRNGEPLYYEDVEKAAFQKNISLRGGCFCNPGGSTRAFEVDGLAMAQLLARLQNQTRSQAGVPGSVRISFGIANAEEDVDAVIDFIRELAN